MAKVACRVKTGEAFDIPAESASAAASSGNESIPVCASSEQVSSSSETKENKRKECSARCLAVIAEGSSELMTVVPTVSSFVAMLGTR